MTSSSKLPVFLFLMVLAAGCERVIDLDVGENASLPVMSFRLNADSGQILGTITRSVDYFSPEEPEVVLDAEVHLISEAGDTTFVPSQALSGFYVSQEVGDVFADGSTAALEVRVDGVTYRAENAAAAAVLPLDSLEVREAPEFPFGDPLDSASTQYEVYLHFPAAAQSHNLLVEYFVNGEPETGTIQVLKTSPNTPTIIPLGWNQRFFDPGEAVLVWAWTLPEDSYDYWLALSNIAGSAGPGGVPGNPPNHWDQEALGHFTVGRLEVAEVFMPQ